MTERPRVDPPDEGGDPACWAHLVDELDDTTPSQDATAHGDDGDDCGEEPNPG
jgi:hypothetical protein